MSGAPVMNITAMDLAPEVVPAMTDWYDNLHIPGLLKLGEIRRVRRFRRIDRERQAGEYLGDYKFAHNVAQFMTLYDFANEESFRRYNADPIFKSGSPAAMPPKEAMAGITGRGRVLFERIYTSAGRPDEASTANAAGPLVINFLGADIDPKVDKLLNDWYHAEHIPEMLATGEVSRAERFRRLASEGFAQYLTIYEYPDEAAYRRYNAHPNLRAAHGITNTLLEGHGKLTGGIVCREQFELLGTWHA